MEDDYEFLRSGSQRVQNLNQQDIVLTTVL